MVHYLDSIKDENLKLIPQSVIKRVIFPKSETRNAIWDMFVTKGGRCFFSLCAEQGVSRLAGLYEYDYESNTCKPCFETENIICHAKDAIVPSKIHTSMCEMNDGRIILTTHTTAKSPVHPYWHPEPFYNHVFEGYQGSNILIYDPVSGAVENRGVPIPHESIYGGCYDPTHNCFYFTGYIRGYLYRYDIDDGKVTEYGKVTEFGSWRLYRASDGNIYSASRSGNFYRINTATQKIEDLGIFFEKDYMPYSVSKHVQLDYIGDGPDGNLYLKYIFGKNLYKYSYSENTLTLVGDYLPESIERTDPYSQYGVIFDENGVLWYTISMCDAKSGESMRVYLCRWDVLHGGKPKNMGLVGTMERSLIMPSELHYHDGILYIADSNHLFAPPGMIGIDLRALDKLEYDLNDESIPYAHDILNYKHFTDPKANYKYSEQEYDKQFAENEVFFNYTYDYWDFLSENSFAISAHHVEPYPLWRDFGNGNSSVKSLYYDSDGTLYAEFSSKGKMLRYNTKTRLAEEITEPKKAEAPSLPAEARIPSAAGRAFKAVVTASVEMKDGELLIGTEDGMLGIWNGKSTYTLGACPNTSGKIAALAYCAKTEKAYGIAGGKNDICILFSYDKENGVNYLGRAHFNIESGLYLNSVLNTVAVSPDGKRVAIGSEERMGAFYDITI